MAVDEGPAERVGVDSRSSSWQAVRRTCRQSGGCAEAEPAHRECFVCASGGTVERDERQCHDEAEEMKGQMDDGVNAQQQAPPGLTALMEPVPDHGESSYVGHGRLEGKKTIITGGDSGIGRAVAIAFAREGADVLISYLEEDDDASETARWVREEGREAALVPGDLADPSHCRRVIDEAVDAFGHIDVLVNNAALQRTYSELEEIPDEEWELHFRTNISAMFYLCKAAVPHMHAGGSIINTASVNVDMPKPTLLPYATTKGAIANFTAGLA